MPMKRRDFIKKSGIVTWWAIMLWWGAILTSKGCFSGSDYSKINLAKFLDLHIEWENDAFYDQREVWSFQKILSSYEIYQDLVNQEEEIQQIWLDEILPLRIKESRLSFGAKNSWSWVDGIGQLWRLAKTDVYNKRVSRKNLQTHAKTYINENEKLSTLAQSERDQLTKEAEETSLSILYYDIIKHDYLKKYFDQFGWWDSVSESDKISFASATYNLWYWSFKAVHKELGSPTEWSDFTKAFKNHFFRKKWSRLNPTKEFDESYGVPDYNNFFTNEKYDDILWENFISTPVVTYKKMKEVIRYVELTWSMRDFLDSKPDIAQTLSDSSEETIYSQIQSYIQKLRSQWLIQLWCEQELRKRILLDNQINPQTDGHISFAQDEVHTMVVNKELVDSFLIPEDYQWYDHTSITFSSWYYFWSILNDIIHGNAIQWQENMVNIQKLRKIVDSFHTHNDHFHEDEALMELRTWLEQAIFHYNNNVIYWWRDPTQTNNVLIPPTKFLERFLKETITVDPKAITQTKPVVDPGDIPTIETERIGNLYINPEDDARWLTVLSRPRSLKPVERISNKHIRGKPKMSHPSHIILHGTAWWRISNWALSSTICHFLVRKNGDLVQMVNGKNWTTEKKIDRDSLTQLDHAWKMSNNRSAAIRDGDGNITFKSIGIEIETWENEDFDINDSQYKTTANLLEQLCSHLNIPAKNILSHQHVWLWKRFNTRGRKTDPQWFDTSKLNNHMQKKIPDIWDRLDPDVLKKKVSPNISAIKWVLRDQWQSRSEITNQINYLTHSTERASPEVMQMSIWWSLFDLFSTKAIVLSVSNRSGWNTLLYQKSKKEICFERWKKEKAETFTVKKLADNKISLQIWKELTYISGWDRKNNKWIWTQSDSTYMRLVTDALNRNNSIQREDRGNLYNEFDKIYDLLKLSTN